MKYFSLFLCLTISSVAMAYELVVIQTVAKEGKSFVTRQGKQDGITEYKRSTFTYNNVSIICVAEQVTQTFTRWRILNDHATIPFQKGEVVTHYDAKEYLWALNQDEVRKKYVPSHQWESTEFWHINLSLIQGVNESFASSNNTDIERGGIELEFLYERELAARTSWLWGARYTREAQNFAAASVVNTRAILTAEVRYHFKVMRTFYDGRPYLGLAAGYGYSRTSTAESLSTGTSTLLPATKLGLEFPMEMKNRFLMIETSLESVRNEETAFGDNPIDSNLNNFRTSIGMKSVW